MRTTQEQATERALRERRMCKHVRMAIVLTRDEDTGELTHEYCPDRHVETLYGPLLRAGHATVVDRV